MGCRDPYQHREAARYRAAEAAVRWVLINCQLSDTKPEASRAHDWLEKALADHPDRSVLLPMAKVCAEKILKGDTSIPFGYEDA